jgi:ribosome-associated protein
MTDINSKKNVAQLQKLVIDGLEDVKAQDIKVFNTESLSPLFERVIIASGTSNRQTKALASSVRDVVREAGFGKPRVEGEENGEWIIVDCGAVVAHIMQPAIREYYHLEEIWGEKPVRFKHGEDKMSELVKERAPKPSESEKAGKTGKTGKAVKDTKSSKAALSSKGTPAKRGAKDRQEKPGDEKVSAKRASATKSASSSAKGIDKKLTSAAKSAAPGLSSKSKSTAKAKPRSKAATKTSPKNGEKATSQSTTSVAQTLSSARTKSASSKSKAGSSAPTVKTRNSPPRA